MLNSPQWLEELVAKLTSMEKRKKKYFFIRLIFAVIIMGLYLWLQLYAIQSAMEFDKTFPVVKLIGIVLFYVVAICWIYIVYRKINFNIKTINLTADTANYIAAALNGLKGQKKMLYVYYPIYGLILIICMTMINFYKIPEHVNILELLKSFAMMVVLIVSVLGFIWTSAKLKFVKNTEPLIGKLEELNSNLQNS